MPSATARGGRRGLAGRSAYGVTYRPAARGSTESRPIGPERGSDRPARPLKDPGRRASSRGRRAAAPPSGRPGARPAPGTSRLWARCDELEPLAQSAEDDGVVADGVAGAQRHDADLVRRARPHDPLAREHVRPRRSRDRARPPPRGRGRARCRWARPSSRGGASRRSRPRSDRSSRRAASDTSSVRTVMPTLKLAATTERVRVASAESSSRCRASKPVVPTTSAAPRSTASAACAHRRVGHAREVEDDVLGAEDALRVADDRHAERRAARDHAGVLADPRDARRLDGARDAEPASSAAERDQQPAHATGGAADDDAGSAQTSAYSRSTRSSCARLRRRSCGVSGRRNSSAHSPTRASRSLHRDRVHLEADRERPDQREQVVHPVAGRARDRRRAARRSRSTMRRGTTFDADRDHADAARCHDRQGHHVVARPDRETGLGAGDDLDHLLQRAARLLDADDVRRRATGGRWSPAGCSTPSGRGCCRR